MESVRELNRKDLNCIIRTSCVSSLDGATELEFINTPDIVVRPVLAAIGHQLRVLTVPTVHCVLDIAFPNLHTLVVSEQPVDSSAPDGIADRRKAEAWLFQRFGVDTAEPGSTPLHTIVDCGVVPGNDAAQASKPRMVRRKRALYKLDESDDDDLEAYYDSKRRYGNMTRYTRSLMESAAESAARLQATNLLKPAQYQVVETFIPPAAGTGGIRAPQLTNITIQYAKPANSDHLAIRYPFKLPPGLPYRQVKELTLIDAQLEGWADVFLLELPEATRLRLVDAQVLETWRVADDRISELVVELQRLELAAAAGLLHTKKDTRGTIPIPFWCVMPQLNHLSVVQTYPGNKPFPLYGHTLYLLDDAFPALKNLSLVVSMPRDEQNLDNGPLVAEYLAILDQMGCQPYYKHGIKIGFRMFTTFHDAPFVEPNTEHKSTFQYASHSIAVSCKMMRPRDSEARSSERRRSMRADYKITQCNCAHRPNTVALDVPTINKTQPIDRCRVPNPVSFVPYC